MQIVGVSGVGKNFEYQWPDNTERYRHWVEYEARDQFDTHLIRIGYGTRNAYGRDRERVVVWVDGRPAAEFSSADDFETTGEVVCVLRATDDDGTLRNVRFPDDPVPERYLMFHPVEFRTWIDQDGAPYAWAVVANVSDHHRMAAFAAVRNLDRVLI